MLTDQLHSGVQLSLGNGIGPGQDDGLSGLDLIVIELAKVLHIDLYLAGIGHGHSMAQHHMVIGHLLHSGNHIAELANAGGLDDDPVGMEFPDHLFQSLAKVAHQAAANAAGVHFGNVDAGILQEAAIDADLAEFVLDQHQFFACVGFLDHLLDEGGLTGAQETGININFSHSSTFCC